MGGTFIWRFISAGVLVLVVGSGQPRAGQGHAARSFQFFAPTVVVSSAQMQRLERDEPVVQTLPKSDGQLAVFAATRLDAPPDALVAWTRRVAELKKVGSCWRSDGFRPADAGRTSTSCLSMNATWRLSANARLVTAG